MGPMEPENDGVGAALERAVATYCDEWRNPSLPPFKIYSHSYTSWHKQIEAGGPGCYAAYAADGTLLYVGKASYRKRIGDRLFVHFEVTKPAWVKHVAHILFVPVTQPFEAPSLEEYLIYELRPVFNAVGRRPTEPTEEI